MSVLKIVASGETKQAKSNARGNLFEKLSANILRHLGYSIDRKPNVNYAGMEIDIEGSHIATKIPMYTECKCYSNEIDSPKIQAFFGKYMTRWLKDNRVHGLLLVIPGLNPHAKGFYRENLEARTDITFSLYQENEIIDVIYQTENIIQSDQLKSLIKNTEGSPGDSILLYTSNGFFWIQYIIPHGGSLPNSVIIFDGRGKRISDKASNENICSLYPDLQGIKILNSNEISISHSSINIESDQIVEVQKSSSFFEYQYPTAPEFFVGRDDFLNKVDLMVEDILNSQTSDRGILFQAHSGWGKSSAALAAIERLKKKGHFAIAIDSRTASTPQFILKSIDYALKEYLKFDQATSQPKEQTLTGFEGATNSLIAFGKLLKTDKRIFMIFFDQFENIFFIKNILKPINNMLSALCNEQTNVIFGFAWKTDLVGFMDEFPYAIRDSIRDSCRTLNLNRFSEKETEALFIQLTKEIKAKLNKMLKSLLSEFSRGYPWLLKRLCVHVKNQREKGVSQAKIAEKVLNAEELFKEDLIGLSAIEEETLRSIARVVPISISDVGDEYDPAVVQSLVDRRLLIRVGSKYDTYWDIFRDFLNTGKIPIDEHYILRVQLGSVIKIIEILVKNNGSMDTKNFYLLSQLSEKSFQNILRDMRIIGLMDIENNFVCLKYDFSKDSTDSTWPTLRNYLRDKLSRNRVAKMVIETLHRENEIDLSSVAVILKKVCPYISANDKTWKFYAKVMQDWLDFSDIAILDRNTSVIRFYDSSKEVRQNRKVRLNRRNVRNRIDMPPIQYRPIEYAAIQIVKALKSGEKIKWTDVAKSTRTKSLAALELLGFIKRNPDSLLVYPNLQIFVERSKEREKIFCDAAQKLEPFNVFHNIVKKYSVEKVTQAILAKELNNKMNANWTEETSKTNCKILMDWVRAAGLAPSIYRNVRSKSKD